MISSRRARRAGSGSGRATAGATGLATGRGFASAAVLVVAGVATGWLAFRTTMIRALPPTASIIQRVADDAPDVVLGRSATALVTQRGILAPAVLDQVRQAARTAPLDARAFLVLGHQQILDGTPVQAVATLEAGQRLDPRQRVIHLLLLDRYLRTERYTKAAQQFSVLARLLGSSQQPIATAMAQMMLRPAMRDPARRALATDPVLERAVMTTLARSDTAPTAIFTLASPRARADARTAGSWGPVLVSRLVAAGDYATARAVWQRVYAVPSAGSRAAITNAGFAPATPAPPFDWTLVAGSLGAADLRGGSLSVDYYGRDSGDLATQLLVLAPGRYRFAVTVDAGKTDDTARLFWSVACGSGTASDTGRLLDLRVAATAHPHRIAGSFAIPAGCPAQTLSLRGEAGEFPSPVSLTLRAPAIDPLPEGTP